MSEIAQKTRLKGLCLGLVIRMKTTRTEAQKSVSKPYGKLHKLRHYGLQIVFFCGAIILSALAIRMLLHVMEIDNLIVFNVLYFLTYGCVFVFTKRVYSVLGIRWRYAILLVLVVILIIVLLLIVTKSWIVKGG